MVRGKRSSRQKVNPQSPESAPQTGKTAADSFPIVGVGASAGGLEAMERLLKHMPVRTGMAFLLVQHLDPKHESMLTDILSRTTSMAVSETKDGMRVEPNHVYIIPPNASMSLWDTTLRLEPRDDFKAHYLPVDTLFRSCGDGPKKPGDWGHPFRNGFRWNSRDAGNQAGRRHYLRSGRRLGQVFWDAAKFHCRRGSGFRSAAGRNRQTPC